MTLREGPAWTETPAPAPQSLHRLQMIWGETLGSFEPDQNVRKRKK